jgi:hypothetical protein
VQAGDIQHLVRGDIEFRSAPGQSRPRFEEWVCFLVEAIEMIGYPQTVKLWSYRGKDVLALVLHYRLKVAPLVANDRR